MEVDIMRNIQVNLSLLGARVFRNNVGLGWIGKRVQRFHEDTMVLVSAGDVIVRSARPLHAGLVADSADLIGWDADTGLFVSCEVKQPGQKLSEGQENFMRAVNTAGGIGIWADSQEMATKKYVEAKIK